MITVGLDLSLTGTGFCLLEEGSCSVKTIKTKPADFETDIDRYKHIVFEVNKHIPQETDLICVEDYFMPQSRAQFGAAISLVALGTLVRSRLHDNNFPFITVVPSQLKKWILGKGNGAKNLVIREVFKKLGLDAKDDNQADAIVLAHIAQDIVWKMNGIEPPKATKPRKDVISTIISDRPRYNCKKLFNEE